jgi:hypothetical protein
MSGSLLFTLNGQPYNITPTTVNPLSNPTTPPSGNWNYYYYTQSGNPCDNLVINYIGANPLGFNLCVFAQGGNGGKNGSTSGTLPSYYTFSTASGGGGGGGKVTNTTLQLYPTNSTININLYPIGSTSPCQLQGSNIAYGHSGTNGETIYSNNTGGTGGNGGTGGGAGGNYGGGGRITNTSGHATIIYQAPDGQPGIGYYPNNTGSEYGSAPKSTQVTFADGTSANIASAGTQKNSGQPAGFLIYYQITLNPVNPY